VSQSSRFTSIIRLSAPAIIVACALFLPFLNKAYLIDDPYFLMQAESVRHEFLRPQNFTLCWFHDCVCGPVAQLAPGAALMGYFLLPAIMLGALEPLTHLLQLLALLAAVMATVSLALRFGAAPVEARFAGLLLVTFPPVLALTDTAMPDTLAMSLGVIGLERFVAWRENGRIGSAIMAALALGLAPYARLHALGLIGVGVVAAALQLWRNSSKSRLRWIGFSPLLAAIAIFLGVSHITREPGLGGSLPPQSSIMWERFGPNIRALFLNYVICFPIAVLWLISVRRGALWLVSAASCVFLICLGLVKMPAQAAVLWTLAAVAALCIAQMHWEGFRTRSPGLLLSIWLLVPCAVLPYRHLPSKYLMVTAPAAAIAGMALLRKESPAFRNAVATAAIGVFGIASLFILQADTQFAEMSRQASADLIAPRVAQGEKVWFTGQWGLYWYAQKAGANVVMAGVSEPKSGDLLVTGKEDGGAPVLERFPRRQLVAERVFAWTGGRTMSMRDKAGLYSNFWGPLPWSWGSGEVDRFQLWRIK
jgi:hypothetical protein